jgi:hypothetical protein
MSSLKVAMKEIKNLAILSNLGCPLIKLNEYLIREVVMEMERLSTAIEQPNTIKKLMGNYKGGYSLGISLYSKDKSRIAISICVEDREDNSFPKELEIGDEVFPVEVQKNFQMPIAL